MPPAKTALNLCQRLAAIHPFTQLEHPAFGVRGPHAVSRFDVLVLLAHGRRSPQPLRSTQRRTVRARQPFRTAGPSTQPPTAPPDRRTTRHRPPSTVYLGRTQPRNRWYNTPTVACGRSAETSTKQMTMYSDNATTAPSYSAVSCWRRVWHGHADAQPVQVQLGRTAACSVMTPAVASGGPGRSATGARSDRGASATGAS